MRLVLRVAARLAGAVAMLGLAASVGSAQETAPKPPRTRAAASNGAHHGGVAPAVSAAERNPFIDRDLIAPDPDVIRGVLPNGLRYLVAHNDTPKGAVSLRLTIETGSFDERDDERGVAHYLEHMGFNGTRNFPEGGLDKPFSDAGVEFGRDLNAATGFWDTNYRIDVPHSDPDRVALAFRWLRDVADGMVLSDNAVAHERGVIQSERTRSLGPAQTFGEAFMRFRAPNSRAPDRLPIGTAESIGHVDAAHLHAFYERWYRPDNAIVVVVGDLPAEALADKVKAAFGSWSAKGAAPQHATPHPVDAARGLDVLVRSEPQLPTLASVCRLRSGEPKRRRTAADLRREAVDRIWVRVLNERLTRLQSAATPAFLGAVVSYDDKDRETASTCLTLAPLNGEWRRGLDAGVAEVRRFEAYGPTAEEMKASLLYEASTRQGAIDVAPTKETQYRAAEMMQAERDGDVYATPEELRRAFEHSTRTEITAEEVTAAFHHAWTGAGPLLAVAAPDAPTAEAVKAAWGAEQGAPAPTKAVAVKAAAWGYARLGAAGKVTKREALHDPDFVRLTFANGVILNFKQTTFSKGRVWVGVVMAGGREALAPSEVFAGIFGASLFKDGGTRRNSYEEIKAQFRDVDWDVRMSVDSHVISVDGGPTSPQTLDEALHILAAYVSDPGFRPSVDARLPTAIETFSRLWRSEPTVVMGESLIAKIAPDSPMALPSKARLSAYRSADFEAALKPQLTRRPLELNIVGDIDEEAAVALAANTFGALPPRPPVAQAAPGWFLRYPDGPGQTIRATHEGSAEKAVVGVTWPLYVAEPKRRREEYALNLVARILDNDLRHRIREGMGKTYAPSARTEMPDFADQGSMTATVETAPGDVDEVAEAVLKSAQRLASGDIGQAELDAARKPFLEQLAARSSNDQAWLAALAGSSLYPAEPHEFMFAHDDFQSITLEEVRQAAAQWLARRPWVVIVTPAAGPATTAVGQHP